MVHNEGQAWYSGESYLTKSLGCGFKVASSTFMSERLASDYLFFSSSDLTYVGASSTVLFFNIWCIIFEVLPY